MKQDPSDHLFVIDAPREPAAERLASLGTVEPLEGNDRLLVLSVPSGAEGDAETRWAQARELLGDLGTVQPVLLDETGEAHFPTGEIAVRFHEAPPDERLQELAAEHGLRLRDRNEYVPQQAVFRPADPTASYLPKVVRELAQTQDVKAAWANTLSRFRRGV
ncbi:MAG TPA: hypothetical protein VHN15_03230 [Thermoanaerobaculia bacterium]|nr:hypothetical protein [Thermoanaerobaculia bacterium]